MNKKIPYIFCACLITIHSSYITTSFLTPTESPDGNSSFSSSTATDSSDKERKIEVPNLDDISVVIDNNLTQIETLQKAISDNKEKRSASEQIVEQIEGTYTGVVTQNAKYNNAKKEVRALNDLIKNEETELGHLQFHKKNLEQLKISLMRNQELATKHSELEGKHQKLQQEHAKLKDQQSNKQQSESKHQQTQLQKQIKELEDKLKNAEIQGEHASNDHQKEFEVYKADLDKQIQNLQAQKQLLQEQKTASDQEKIKLQQRIAFLEQQNLENIEQLEQKHRDTISQMSMEHLQTLLNLAKKDETSTKPNPQQEQEVEEEQELDNEAFANLAREIMPSKPQDDATAQRLIDNVDSQISKLKTIENESSQPLPQSDMDTANNILSEAREYIHTKPSKTLSDKAHTLSDIINRLKTRKPKVTPDTSLETIEQEITTMKSKIEEITRFVS